LAIASPTITVGTPNSFGFGLSPTFGTLINFDDQTPFATVASDAYSAEGVESVANSDPSDPLIAALFSQQSEPIYLTTADNVADIDITFASATDEVGIGLLNDGVTPATLTVYDAAGDSLGSFVETAPLNGYYVISDTSDDIKSFSIGSQAVGIDDLQFAPTPEPGSISFAAVGLAIAAGVWRKKAARKS
jgi:hypothetical protein